MTFKDIVNNHAKKIGYKGCKNCIHQPEPLTTCGFHDGQIHLICPHWEKKKEKSDE